MDIDYSKIYSVVSANEEKEKAEIERIFSEFEDLNIHRGANVIKEYIREKYGLQEGQTCFFLSKTAPVNIIEREKTLVLQLKYQDENNLHMLVKLSFELAKE